MELHEIENKWVDISRDKKASLAAWNSMAQRYNSEIPQPRWDSSPFLIQLDREVPLSKSMSVLDIGCGTGGYAAAVAERAGNVTCIDISEKMLSHAKALAANLGIENVEFICSDFCELEMDRKFDLVFAHLTPAVSGAAAFKKMLSLSSDYCYLVKPVHRSDPVFDEIKKLAGHSKAFFPFDRELYYAFSMLWSKGILPALSYYPAEWQMEKTLEEAQAWYINRLKSHKQIDSATEKKASAYLEEIAVDKKVYETISTTVATMGWRMSGEENK